MGTVNILGKEYKTGIFAGIEWMMEALNHPSSGVSSTIGDATGWLYFSDTLGTLIGEIGGGWRLPSTGEWLAMTTEATLAIGMPKLKETGTAHWDSPNTGAEELNGFKLLPFGFTEDGSVKNEGIDCAVFFYNAGSAFNALTTNNDGATAIKNLEGASCYLVRPIRNKSIFVDNPYSVDLGVAPEMGYEPAIAPSLTWNQLPSGLWRALDDGAEFDAHDVDLTYYVSTAKLAEWETFISANRGAVATMYVPDGVYPFGPHVDPSSGLQVVIGDAWKEAGRVGTKADCWKLHIPIRWQDKFTPTSAAVPSWLGRKYATPNWIYPTKVHATDDGRSLSVPRSPESQTCTVTVDNLDTVTAAAAVNWALYTRGNTFAYAPASGMYPFGPSVGDGPFLVRLIGWTIQKPRPNRWDMSLQLVREG